MTAMPPDNNADSQSGTIPVNVAWLQQLVNYAELAEKNPDDIGFLIGYAKSAKAIINRGADSQEGQR